MGSGYRACYCHRRGGHFICRAGQIEAQLIVESGALIDDDTAFGGVEIIDPNRRDILANPSAGDCLIATVSVGLQSSSNHHSILLLSIGAN